MTEKAKEVEKMIAKVEKKKDLTRAQAIDYMLGVATGRLAALWRYDDSLAEGKTTKGILTTVGKKKRAEKTARISILPESHTAAKREKPTKKPAKRSAASEKPAKNKPAKKRKAKPVKEAEQLEISATA